MLILTSSAEEEDRALGFDLGEYSCLVKPISFDGFLGVVAKIKEYWLSLNFGPHSKA